MPSGIYYGVIARQGVVLCNYATLTGNFERVAVSILQQTDGNPPKISYESGRYLFHVFVSAGITYMVVTDGVFDRGVAFACLHQMEHELTSRPQLKECAFSINAYKHCLQQDFQDILESLVRRYSSSDKMTNLEDKVATVKGVMTKSIDKVMRRGENLDDLTERSELLNQSSNQFRRNSTKLRRKLCCNSVRLWIIVIVSLLIVLAVIVGIIIALAASGVFKKHEN